jgi:hypothetical protein
MIVIEDLLAVGKVVRSLGGNVQRHASRGEVHLTRNLHLDTLKQSVPPRQSSRSCPFTSTDSRPKAPAQ